MKHEKQNLIAFVLELIAGEDVAQDDFEDVIDQVERLKPDMMQAFAAILHGDHTELDATLERFSDGGTK